MLHIPWTYVLDADLLPGRHELVMRVPPAPMQRAPVTRCAIAHLLAKTYAVAAEWPVFTVRPMTNWVSG